MATNAPYYHMRGGQFTNPANTSFMPDHAVAADYDLASPTPTNLSPNDAAATIATSAPYTYAEHRQSEETELPINSLEDNHHFVELLEAATTAAAGQAIRVNDTQMEGDFGRGKRKRISSSPPADGGAANSEQSKRAKTDMPLHLKLHDLENAAREGSESSSLAPSNESLLNDARAAGVHSAAALFRRTSEKASRKYTRPPMSKLFISLQLSPENFLHLQAQAKSYMLDPAHPERRSCVGSRGKGDTDMVKLKLFNCVRDFLSDGAGERYYGEGVEKPHKSDTIEAARALGEDKLPNEQRLVWPRDGNKIISLVTPLLRRMVTNERQRMYAIETRKGGSKKKEATPTSPQDETQTTDDVGQAAKQVQPLPTSPLAAPSPQLSTPFPTPAAFTSPSSDRGVAPLTQYIELDSTTKILPGEKLKLPTEHDPEPHLSKINIFVIKNGHALRNEKRFINVPSAPLMNMTWQELSIRVRELIKESLLLYPELEEALKRPANMGPEALQGLAAAATEMHRNSMQGSTESGVNDTNNTAGSASSHARPASDYTPSTAGHSLLPSLMGSTAGRLPEFRIGAQTSQGWSSITIEEDWARVKNDAARAAWADKTCNIVVTLLP
ncbi:hypothetical protein DM02DRAFT_641329 [Periconia macrospinosa]|uniref:Uncharacterized protein n=1 Tax=Periconia macrospinosa TaxID=97972 RepID=A0A2V1DVX2_9PLEO|nr:hypothetical protein DM02DRAFT_641329 [Periconia macrospinosa]